MIVLCLISQSRVVLRRVAAVKSRVASCGGSKDPAVNGVASVVHFTTGHGQTTLNRIRSASFISLVVLLSCDLPN